MAGKAVVCFVGLYGNPARAVDEIRRFLLADRHGRTRRVVGGRKGVVTPPVEGGEHAAIFLARRSRS